MLETNKNSGRDGNEKLETITVVPHKERRNETKPASPSWFVAKINPVSRFIGALILCIPMFFTLDVVSASVAFGLEMLLLWIGGVAPWTVLRKTWPVWIAATGSFVSVALYGKISGTVLANLGGIIVISQGSLYLALATFLRVAAIAVPGVILALGLDPTDLADGLVQILRCRNVSYTAALPACACSRCCRTIGVHSASHAARVASATAAPSNASSRKHSACSSYPSDVERNSPPPWKRADSDPTRHEAKRANRNCMRSTGCSTPSASRCRQSRWPPHTTPATGIGRSATCPTNG